MSTDNRATRLDEYREMSRLTDEFASSGQTDKALALLKACHDMATAAGDEDYRLFFEAELLGYTTPDLPAQIALLDKALACPPPEDSQPDFFILRNKGVYIGKLGDEKGAIELFEKALAIKPDDYNSLRNKGVSLSKMGDEKGAIELFEKALAIKPDDYNSLRNKGVSLSKMGDEKGAIELFEKALAIKPDDYNSLRNKGVCLSKMGDEKGAIELFEKALAIKPDDYNSLRNKGVSLSKMGDEKGAIELFEKALAIKPDDNHTLRNKGVSLSNMGDEKGAIELFERALAIKPDDYNSLRNKGVSLIKMGEEKGAIELFEKALAIKPDDYNTLRIKGVCLSKMGEEKGAIELFKKALAIKQDDSFSLRNWSVSGFNMGDHTIAYEKMKQAAKLDPEAHQDAFRSIMRLIKKDPDKEWQALFPDQLEISVKPPDPLQEIRDFVRTIRDNLGDNGPEFLKQKAEAEKNIKMFLHPESLLASDMSFFLVLRKWNSYTPAIPTDEVERSKGGGYFLYHRGKGTLIDPGYNFIENFHQAGCRIHDIDTIIITHAHNDHTIDFESICSLLHQYNRDAEKGKKYPKKKINLYFNNGAFKKFSGLLNLMDKNFETIHTLNAGNEYQVSEGMQLTVLPAFHDEVVSRDQSIGLCFNIECGSNIKKIVFTSDTGLFPLYPDFDAPKPDTSRDELWAAYPESARENIDLLVVHIGSIKTEELEVDLNLGLDNCLYPNHLGMIGTARMITQLRPKLALVSEFGEEMRQFRRAIVERIELDVVHKYITTEPKPRVAPADLAFVYDIAQGKFLCCAQNAWVDVAEIAYNYDHSDKKEDLYYFSKTNLLAIDPSAYTPTIDEFKKRRRERTGMYFRHM